MGPLSGVAVAVSFFLLAATWLGWIAASTHVLGWIWIIAVILILIDCFWHGRTWISGTVQRRRGVVVQAPPQA
jgi:hypothetical protein